MNERTVLCIDDEVNLLKALERLLRKEGYTFLTAGGGHEALDVLKSQPVHLVISDQRMPEMTGIEFLQKAKELFPDVVRVVLSGYADVPAIVEAINKGEIYRFLSKPWNDEELKAAITQCLEHYDIVQQNRQLVEQVRRQNEDLRRMNEDLEQAVEDRTRSLRLSQEILEKLPIPVVGVGADGMFVFSNDVARRTFPELSATSLGADMARVLPQNVAEIVTRCLREAAPFEPPPLQWGGHEVRVHVEPLLGPQQTRGCILMWEVVA